MKKKIILTGADGGIGFEILKKFSNKNFKIIACTRKKNSIFKRKIKEISNKNKMQIDNYIFDLSDNEIIKKNINNIIDKEKKIDVLINNAAIMQPSILMMAEIKSIISQFQINLFSHINLCQLIAKNMIKHKNGVIINITSSAIDKIPIGLGIYTSTKSALESFSKTLARELGNFNIRVNNISPGFVETKMMRKNTSEAQLNEMKKRISLNKLVKAQDVANYIYFLASKEASMINGETVKINGGFF